MSLPWFPCYHSDLLGSLRWRSMTNEERGAYWQLLCFCFDSATGKLQATVEQLSRLAEIDLNKHPLILSAFKQDESGAWFNERAYSEWLKRKAISAARAEAGAKGGKTAKQKRSNSKASAKAIATTSTSTSTGNSNNKEKEYVHPQASAPLHFDEFWKAYPRKQDKAEAKRVFPKAIKKTTISVMLEAIAKQSQSEQWRGGIIPLPTTWLNKERWQDEGTVLPERDLADVELPF